MATGGRGREPLALVMCNCAADSGHVAKT